MEINDEVIDLTSLDKPEWHGKVVEIDGTSVKIRYPNGLEEWRSVFNVVKIEYKASGGEEIKYNLL